ncbi:MAG: hypothetical protein ACE5H9_21105 [Anaerolineae bacterium]
MAPDSDPLWILLEDVRRFVLRNGQSDILSSQAVYERLESWSLMTLARMEAVSGTLAMAFTFGGDLADTFWGMRAPPRYQPQGKARDSWHTLLDRERVLRLIRRGRRLQPHLSTSVGLALRHSLWEWNLARELSYSEVTGSLSVVYPGLHRWRALSGLRWLRERLKRDHRPPETLPPAQEKALHDRLSRQAETWADLIHGTREPTEHLKPSDWRAVSWLAAGMSLVTTTVILALIVIAVVLLIRLATLVYSRFAAQIALPTGFSEQWTLVTTLVAVALGLVTQAGRVLRGLASLYRRGRSWLVERKVEQRTLFSWDGRIKPFFFLILEGIIFHWRGMEE